MKTTLRPIAFAASLVVGLLTGTGCKSECADCQQEKCSDLLAYCDADSDCACVADCVGDKSLTGVDSCVSQCGVDQRPPAWFGVEACVAVACPDKDECAGAGHVVPSPPVEEDPPAPSEIAAGDQPDCGFDDSLAFDAESETLQLQSEGGDICVRLQRRNDGAGSLANTQWTLLQASVGPVGQVGLVQDPGDLCWFSSHHNFSDWAHLWTGVRRFDLQLTEDGHGGARGYALHAFEAGAVDPGACAPLADGTASLGGPITLVPYAP